MISNDFTAKLPLSFYGSTFLSFLSFFFLNYVFIYFSPWVFPAACELHSSCTGQGGLLFNCSAPGFPLQRFSCCGSQAVGVQASPAAEPRLPGLWSTCGTRAWIALRHVGDLPGQGSKPCPCMTGRFLTTGPNPSLSFLDERSWKRRKNYFRSQKVWKLALDCQRNIQRMIVFYSLGDCKWIRCLSHIDNKGLFLKQMENLYE